MLKCVLLVGCNYFGIKCELYGCVNDVRWMKELLMNCFGFDEIDILVMLDIDLLLFQFIGVNICKSLVQLIQSIEVGDCFVFYYSGYGIQVYWYLVQILKFEFVLILRKKCVFYYCYI